MINSKNITHIQASNRIPIAQRQAGFTLIELIIVITLLGILSAVAVPRFIDLSVEAHKAAVSGTAGAFAVGLMLVRSDAVMKSVLPHTSMEINGANVVVNQDLKPYHVTTNPVLVADEDEEGSKEGCLKLWGILMGDGAPSLGENSSATSDYIVSFTTPTSTAGGCKYTYQKEVSRSINWNKKANKLTITNA
jgi:prepilin-type N-terminal cleavage/methylation domain-containing protein